MINCYYCQDKKPTILKPVPLYIETFFKKMALTWVCEKCNKIYCENLGVIQNESK